MMRHPIFTAEHEELRGTVRRFVDAEVRPHVDEWERAGHFPDALFRRCGELGFLGLHYPARCGGSGGDLATGLVFVEELARCGAGAIPMAISVQTHMATPALAEFGTDDQRERWLRPAIAGTKIGAIAITEPDAGSDVAAIRTRAVRDGDVWRVNGRKMFITNGARAHFLTLVAKTDRDAGHHGVSLFIVDTSLPGRVACRAGSRSSACTRPTPPRSRSTTSRVPHGRSHRARTRAGIRAADVAAAVRAARGRGRVRSVTPRRRSTTRSRTRANARRSAARSRSTR